MASKKFKIAGIVMLVISLLLIGLLLPIGLTDLTGYTGAYNSTQSNGTEYVQIIGTNATIGTLVASIIPIMIVISLILLFIPKGSEM